MLEHHFKPMQCGTIRKQGYNGRHNVEDMIAMIHIAFDFRHAFLRKNSCFSRCFGKTLAEWLLDSSN